MNDDDLDRLFPGHREWGDPYRDPQQEKIVTNHASYFLKQAVIDKCPMCDHQGYRPNGTLCPHTDRYEKAAARGMALIRNVIKTSRRNSVRPTMQAREEAYGRQMLAEQQRENTSPPPCPDCGSIIRCEHDEVEKPGEGEIDVN